MDDTNLNDIAWLSKEEEMLRNRELAEGHQDADWREHLRRVAQTILYK